MTRVHTLYDRLGLDPSATADELRRSYRVAARAVHPDLAHSSTEMPLREAMTRSLTEAYNVLSDPARRRDYDRRLPWRAGGDPLTRWRRRLRRIFLARRWRFGLPHPHLDLPDLDLPEFGLPELPDYSALRPRLLAFGSLLLDTRLGQWGLVVAALGLGQWLLPAVLWGSIGLAAATALALSFGGSPTPLWDAAELWSFFGALGILFASSLREGVRSLLEMIKESYHEAASSPEEMATIIERGREERAQSQTPRYEPVDLSRRYRGPYDYSRRRPRFPRFPPR